MYQRQVTFGEAIQRGLVENYCNFTGRASRSEYWWFYLFTALVGMVAGGISAPFGETFSEIFTYAVALVLFLPSFGITFRRLHDIGKSGWWWLLGFIPLVGAIILIVWFCRQSQEGDNEYGPEPNMVA